MPTRPGVLPAPLCGDPPIYWKREQCMSKGADDEGESTAVNERGGLNFQGARSGPRHTGLAEEASSPVTAHHQATSPCSDPFQR